MESGPQPASSLMQINLSFACKLSELSAAEADCNITLWKFPISLMVLEGEDDGTAHSGCQ